MLICIHRPNTEFVPSFYVNLHRNLYRHIKALEFDRKFIIFDQYKQIYPKSDNNITFSFENVMLFCHKCSNFDKKYAYTMYEWVIIYITDAVGIAEGKGNHEKP